jgi:hypothetical protein
VNAVAEHRGSFRDVGATRRELFAPAFTAPGAHTSTTGAKPCVTALRWIVASP